MKGFRGLWNRGARPSAWEDDAHETETIESLRAWTASRPIDEASLSRSRDVLRAAFVAPNRPAAQAGNGARMAAGRRLAFGGTAAALLLVGSVAGVLAESGPGQPFYTLRLDVEALTLPGAGSPARVDADLARARARLDEAIRAADARDWAAEAAAARAYGSVVSSIEGDSGASSDAVRRTLEGQLAELRNLRARSEAAAADALDGSIARVRAWLAGQASPPGPGAPSGSHAAGTPGPNGGSAAPPIPSPSGGPQGSPGPQGTGGPPSSAGAQGSSGPGTTAGPGASSGPRTSPGPNGTGAGGGSGGPQGPGSSGPTGPGSGSEG